MKVPAWPRLPRPRARPPAVTWEAEEAGAGGWLAVSKREGVAWEELGGGLVLGQGVQLGV